MILGLEILAIIQFSKTWMFSHIRAEESPLKWNNFSWCTLIEAVVADGSWWSSSLVWQLHLLFFCSWYHDGPLLILINRGVLCMPVRKLSLDHISVRIHINFDFLLTLCDGKKFSLGPLRQGTREGVIAEILRWIFYWHCVFRLLGFMNFSWVS